MLNGDKTAGDARAASGGSLPAVNTGLGATQRNISPVAAGHELINTVVQVGAFKGKKQPQQTAHRIA